MACTLDATIGGASANTYADSATADSYHEAHVSGATWSAATATQKCQALQTATRLLDANIDWLGSVASSTQRLLWPRSGVLGANGLSIAETALPRELVDATCEFARVLLAGDRAADLAVDVQGVESMQVGSIGFTFRAGAKSKPIPDAVFYMVAHLGRVKTRGAGSVPLLRS